MNSDISQFRERFIIDATTLLDQMEAELLVLENDRINLELINSVFRAMHTLKGVAGMYGFSKIGEYTHYLENVYDAMRNNEITLTQDIFDITFQSVDHLRNLLDDIDFVNEENKINQSELLSRVEQILPIDDDSLKVVDTKEDELNVKSEANVERTYYILLHANETYVKRGIIVLNIFKELSGLGKYKIADKIYTEPSKSKKQEENWVLFLVTDKNIEDIEKVFMFVLDDCKIVKISDSNIFDTATEAESQAIIELLTDDTSIIEESERLRKLKSEEQLTVSKKVKPSVSTKTEKKESLKKNLQSKSKSINRISVEATKLDNLMYLVGELITVNSQLILSTRSSRFDDIRTYLEQVDKLSEQFRNSALDLRLVPINDMVHSFQRLVLDLSIELGKEVDFQIEGVNTELDKSTIDVLIKPLIHIISNSLEHGIETPDIRESKGKSRIGKINFFAYHQGNNVFINVQDDGVGIDTDEILKKAVEKGFIKADEQLSKQEIYDLIFLPGFSTAQNLTKVSGRGLGMDVVRRKISEVRGEVELTSELGVGTSFTIKLQQSISILDTMLVQVADMFFMLPLSDVEMCTQNSVAEIEKNSYTGTLTHEDELIPFIDLHKTFELPIGTTRNLKTVVLSKQDNKFAIIVDRIIGEHQAVLRPLGKTFENQKLFTSVSVLSDGEMAFMLDIVALQKTIIYEK